MRIFVSHQYSNDPHKSSLRVQAVARELVRENHLPLAPQIYLPQFIDESKERELALKLCLELVALSDEVRVYGKPTEGMRLEIAEAHRLGIPVIEVKE